MEWEKKVNLIYAIKDRPVGRTVADALAKVHQVTGGELHTSEGRDKRLNIFQHISCQHYRKDIQYAISKDIQHAEL